MIKICENCYREFQPKRENQKHCCSKCRNINGVRKWRQNNMKTCLLCTRKILPESKFCKPCQTKKTVTKKLTLGECINTLSVKKQTSILGRCSYQRV